MLTLASLQHQLEWTDVDERVEIGHGVLQPSKQADLETLGAGRCLDAGSAVA
jgi:hypothetical protein